MEACRRVWKISATQEFDQALVIRPFGVVKGSERKDERMVVGKFRWVVCMLIVSDGD